MNERWNIFAKYFSNEELNASESELVQSNIEDEELNDDFRQSKQVSQKVDLYFNLKKVDADQAWTKVSDQMETKTKIRSLKLRWISAAASAVILVAIAIGAIQLGNPFETKTFRTASDDLSNPHVTLPDGSIVSLNHGTKISYHKSFKGDSRMVKLSGEAFFDVAHNPNKPFIIQTKNASIKVLGTSFNVYEGDEKVEVFVKTGKVQLIEGALASNESERINLLPGERGIYDIKSHNLLKEILSETNSLAWITQDIEFNTSDLSEVIETLERVYNLKIEVADDVDMEKQITATFNQQDADYIMEVVAITLDLDLTKTKENEYRIK